MYREKKKKYVKECFKNIKPSPYALYEQNEEKKDTITVCPISKLFRHLLEGIFVDIMCYLGISNTLNQSVTYQSIKFIHH